MGLIGALVVLVIFGLILYLVDNYVPMSPPIKTVVRVVAVLILILWLYQTFIGDIPFPVRR